MLPRFKTLAMFSVAVLLAGLTANGVEPGFVITPTFVITQSPKSSPALHPQAAEIAKPVIEHKHRETKRAAVETSRANSNLCSVDCVCANGNCSGTSRECTLRTQQPLGPTPCPLPRRTPYLAVAPTHYTSPPITQRAVSPHWPVQSGHYEQVGLFGRKAVWVQNDTYTQAVSRCGPGGCR